MKEMIDVQNKTRSAFCKAIVLVCLVTSSLSGWTQITEPFSSWTSRASYGSYSQAGSGGTWTMVSTIVAPSGTSNGTGSTGYTQLQSVNGILTLPTIASGGVGTMTINARVSSSNGGFSVEKYNGSSWVSVQAFTTSATTAVAFTVAVNDASSNLQLRINNTGGSSGRALTIYDINTTISCTPPTVSISGTTTACSSVSLTASGTAGNTYSWSNSGGSSATAVFSTVGTYTVTVTTTNSGCTASASQSITVNAPSTAPTSISGAATKCANGTNTITLTQSGGVLGTSANYQWGSGTTIGTGTIGGATSASYAPTVTAGTNSYWVSVTNGSSCGTTGSGATVSFTGNSPSTAPSSITGGATACANGSNTITLSQSGGTLGTGANYQWGTGTVVGTAPIAGATSASYSPTVTAGSNSYWVSVANTSVCTNPATGTSTTFTGNTTTTSIAPTATQNISTGDNGATLTVTDGSSSPTGHQWYYSTVTGGPYTNLISGATGTTYVPNFATAGPYYVVCVTTYGSPCNTTATSNQVLINETDNSITVGAISGSPFCQGASGVSVPFTYSVASAFPSGTCTFTAQLSSASGSFSSPTILQSVTSDGSGSQSISVTIPSGTAAGTGYRIRVVSTSPSVTGSDNGADLTVSAIPGTPACSTPAAICPGATATITGAGSSSATVYTYWTAAAGGSSVTTGTTPPGTLTGNNLTTPSSLATGSYIYYVQGENGSCLSAARQAVTVTVNAIPAITTGPSTPVATCSGSGTQTLTVAATGTGLTYSWRKAGVAVTNGGVISGQGTSTLTLTNPTATSAASYDVIVSGTCPSPVTSAPVTVTINTAPSITTGPSAPAAVCSGTGTQTLTVAATGTGLTYSWRKVTTVLTNGTVISGQGTNTLTLTTPTTADAGSYNVIVSGTCTPSVTSGSATIAINTAPSISTGPTAPTATCSGSGAQTLTVAATGTGLSYSWRKAGIAVINGGVISGQGTATLTLTAPTAVNAGSYDVVVSGTCSPVSTSGAVAVTVNALPADPTGTITPAVSPACSSTSLSYSSASPAIYWETGSGGISSASPTTSSYTLSSTGTIYARAFDGTCWSSGTVNSGVVTINAPVTIATDPADQSVVAPAATTFTVVGGGTISGYQWQYNDGTGWANVPNSTPYGGMTTATLSLSSTSSALSGYQYRCIVKGTSPCTDVTSAAATLTITTSIWSNPITGTNPGNSDPYTTGDVYDPNIGVSGIGQGSGIAGTSANDRYNTNGWNTSSFNASDYLEFTITPNTGYQIDFSTFTFTGQTSGTGPTSFSFRSSVDGYAGSIGTITSGGGTVSLTGTSFQNVTSAVTFRIYAWGASASGGTFSVNDFSFTGNVEGVCTTPTALVFTTQPVAGQDINEGSAFNIAVAAECAGNNVATGLNTGSVTIAFSGCGLYLGSTLATSGTTLTANFVNGIATFTGLKALRSTQSGVSFTTTNTNGYTNATSNSFNIIAPAGSSSTTTTVASNDFEGSGTWLYNNTTANAISAVGSGGSSGSDVTSIRTSGGNHFLSKSYSANNGTGERGTTNVITFDPVTGLSGYNGGLTFTFNIASCTGLSNGAGGKGVDQSEDLVLEVKLNGSSTWTNVMTDLGQSNKIFSFATTPVYTLSTSSATTISGSSSQSAFKLSLPAGTTSFQFRITATNNRSEESWDIDNVKLKGTTISGGTPTALPSVSVAGGDIVCGASSTTITSSVSDAQGAVTYSWSPTTALSSAAVASPTASPAVNTSYTLTITDADGCTASPASTADVNLVAPQLVLPMVTTVSGGFCDGADGYRYYQVAGSSPPDYFFAIKWATAEASSVKDSATITVTYNPASPFSSTSSSNRDGSVLMRRYWDVNMHGQTLTQSADVKFYYDSLEKSEISDVRDDNKQDAETASGLVLYDVPFKWFKTVGRAMNASVISLIDGNNFSAFNNIALTDANSSARLTESGYLYAKFTVTSFSGGTGGVGFAPSSGVALPVKLLYLTATPVNNNYITLDWATASEINNTGFQIERSEDGVVFENIGWMDGHGNTNNTSTYKSDDKRVQANTIYYYRLRQIDVDGQYEYSNIVSATLMGEKGFAMESLKPNPAANQVTVSVVTENTQSVDVSIADMLGRQVLGQAWQLSPGLNGAQLDISALAQGVYHVTVRSVNSYFTKTLAITR